jgi:hypothetical protein
MARKKQPKPRYIQGELFPDYSVENYAATMASMGGVTKEPKAESDNAKVSNS